MSKITVITICYNEPNIERTCKSVVNQTFQDFEWVVIDGCSDEPTLEIFEKYKYRINTFVSEKDNGIYNAMNKGINLAKGEYLLFLNAGDEFYNNDSLQNFIRNGLDKDIIYADLCLNEDKISKYPEKLDNKFLITSSLPHPSTLIKKDLFEKFGLYNEEYKIVSDYEKWLNFIVRNNCSYKHLDFVCSKFYMDGISSNKKYNNINCKERNDVVKKYFTEKELSRICDSSMKWTFLQQIFSVKNHPDRVHKLVKIFGFKIKYMKRGLK